MVRAWLVDYNNDVEALAKWMRDTLRIGGLPECRRLIAEAIQVQNGD
jgi:hypothetical protein